MFSIPRAYHQLNHGIRTGALYDTLGNVRISQLRYEEGFINHKKALDHFMRTAGEAHHATLRCMLKVA